MPSVISLLTMIRLAEDVVAEVENRACPPVVSFLFTIRLKMWPIFQKAMSEHIEALKKLAEGASAGYFGRSSTVTEATVLKVILILESADLKAYSALRFAIDTLLYSTLLSLSRNKRKRR